MDGDRKGIGFWIALAGAFLVLAVAGAAAVYLLVLQGEGWSARADVKAIGEEVEDQYAAGLTPFVLYEDGAYSVGTTVFEASVEGPSVAFYPGEDSFCVVLTTESQTSYSYSATDGVQDGSCAPPDAQPFDPAIGGSLEALATSEYWFGLSVGDCILDDTSAVSQPDASSPDPLRAPSVVACSEPHFGEVFAIARFEPRDLEPDLAFRLHVRELCEGSVFTEYTGEPYLQSGVFYSVLYPTEEAVGFGADEMVCLLTTGEQVTGSLKGTPPQDT